MTLNDFILKSNIKHNYKYDYSVSDFIGVNFKVKIICNIHGSFEQRASAHLYGQGCKECKLDDRRIGLSNFLKRCSEIHDDIYDYSLIKEYVNNTTKINVICNIHGVFEIKPSKHLLGQGCSKCKKLGLSEFIEKANDKHNYKYDYSLIKDFKNTKTKVDIICPDHGIFNIRINDHISKGIGCSECSLDRIRLSKKDFIKRANIKHDYKYDYSLVENFKINKTKVKIVCNIHGVFEQRVNSHLNGQGCPGCKKLGLTEFIERSNKIHNNQYSYDKTSFENTNDKSIITCSIHGDFIQRISAHLSGQGCPNCKISKGEREISELLTEMNIEYKSQFRFDDCRNIKKLPFDFYIPSMNLCIEYNGEQHYRSVDFFGGIESFNKRIINDNIKKKFCNENNINFLVIRYDENISEKLTNYLK